ncbi:unnamed protein product [Trichogramma brassicae]|uniref:Uncharacterized protein n=1 Tax=Trichogramma brassicae TaxID=86971 RepID=A0A6H5I0T9_9HYME|nr:unnamed protein product [Trichogramma brassicae]
MFDEEEHTTRDQSRTFSCANLFSTTPCNNQYITIYYEYSIYQYIQYYMNS